LLRPDELPFDPHLIERGALFTMSVDGAELPGLRTPVTPRGLEHRPAAPAGRDTAAILREAGFDDAAIDALRSARAIG